MALVRHGANVVVNDLGGAADGTGADRAPADEVAAEIRRMGGAAVANYDNVADFAAAKNIIDACVEDFGRIDILVNVAGIVRPGTICDMSEEDCDAVVSVQLKGTFNCCRHAAAFMRDQGSGRIINTTSDAWRGTTRSANYAAAKGGIVSLTKTVANEMKKYGVTCNAIAPVAATRMVGFVVNREELELRYGEGWIERWLYDELSAPSGPEHVSPIVVYLASQHAAHVTGKVFSCSTGRLVLYSEPAEFRGLYKKGVWTAEELVELMPKTLSPLSPEF